jgi:hypothetical protein
MSTIKSLIRGIISFFLGILTFIRKIMVFLADNFILIGVFAFLAYSLYLFSQVLANKEGA